jgi:GxxExxY protein
MEGIMGQRWEEYAGHAGDEHPHMDVTDAIIGAAIKVQNALGPGVLEEAYKACLAHALRLDGHKALREVRLDLTFEGLVIPNAYVMDVVVEDKVVVEAKTVDRFNDVHIAQLNSYLRFSSMEVGLLLNFRSWPLKEGGIKRIINTHP